MHDGTHHKMAHKQVKMVYVRYPVFLWNGMKAVQRWLNFHQIPRRLGFGQPPGLPVGIILALILGLYAGLILPTLDRQGISWDEATDLAIARSYQAPGGWLLGSQADPSQARLPMAVVALAYQATGRDDLLLARTVSALVGALTIVGAYVYTQNAFGYPQGLLAASILATSPFFLSFARIAFTETDIYPACALVWTLAALSRLDRQRTLGAALLVGGLLGLVLAAKFTAVFLFPAVLFFLLIGGRGETDASPLPRAETLGFVAMAAFFWVYVLHAWGILNWLPTPVGTGGEAAGLYGVGLFLWAAMLAWLLPGARRVAPRWALAGLVLLMASATAVLLPPEHLTNPSIPRSLLTRADQEMGFNPAFSLEALGLHLGCVMFKSSPLVGLGLLLAAPLAALGWRARRSTPAVRLPLLVTGCYFLGLLTLPIAQTFYMLPLLPVLAVLAAEGVYQLFTRQRRPALALLVAAALLLGLDLARCYPDYNLNGYQWLGPRLFMGRPTLGYRAIVQTPSDGVEQAVGWVCDRAGPGDLVAVYAYEWHIVEAACPHPPFYLERGGSSILAQEPAYINVHINHTLREGWSAWFSGVRESGAGEGIFWEPVDPGWLAAHYRQVVSVDRAFGIQAAAVWERR